MLAASLSLAAVLLKRCGRSEAAAVVFSLANDGPVTGHLSQVQSSRVEAYDAALVQARDQQGEERFPLATKQGANMDYHKAVDFVFAELDAASGS